MDSRDRNPDELGYYPVHPADALYEYDMRSVYHRVRLLTPGPWQSRHRLCWEASNKNRRSITRWLIDYRGWPHDQLKEASR